MGCEMLNITINDDFDHKFIAIIKPLAFQVFFCYSNVLWSWYGFNKYKDCFFVQIHQLAKLY